MPCSVAVILCTYNPRPDLLTWALTSVRNQSCESGSFEFVLIDNNSNPPVSFDRVSAELPGRSVQVLREPRQGLIHARVRAIRATTAPLLVFLDDDNYLDPAYLKIAAGIAAGSSDLGCFGGKALGVYESEILKWQEPLLPYLGVRDYGPEPITSRNDFWGEWEPIGAGMVCRRDVAERFVSLAESEARAAWLGRSGKGLMSGEDSLIAHAAHLAGYACSYQPRLVLHHWIKPERLRFMRLARTIAGHGRSQVILQSLRGHPIERRGIAGSMRHLAASLYWNVRNGGIGTGAAKWCWDIGYAAESRRVKA